MNTARVSVEGKRGCGYRKKGGLYLMGDKPSAPCGRMPLELKVCPVCHSGIKPSRGWTWIRPKDLFGPSDCGNPYCLACPVGASPPEEGGLIWIGGQHYKTPADFLAEAARMGISRRLTAVPKRLEVGKTWVFLAHREAIRKPCQCVLPEAEGKGQKDCKSCKGKGYVGIPAIFSAFRPSHVEKVVERSTPEEECEKLRQRGIEPVIVEQAKEGAELPSQG
jgi:hypothetical protein